MMSPAVRRLVEAAQRYVDLAYYDKDYDRAENSLRTALHDLESEAQDSDPRDARIAELEELLSLCDYKGVRAKNIKDPALDLMIKSICEHHGYGAVMDSAQRSWWLKDQIGCFTIGPCAGSVRVVLEKKPTPAKEAHE